MHESFCTKLEKFFFLIEGFLLLRPSLRQQSLIDFVENNYNFFQYLLLVNFKKYFEIKISKISKHTHHFISF